MLCRKYFCLFFSDTLYYSLFCGTFSNAEHMISQVPRIFFKKNLVLLEKQLSATWQWQKCIITCLAIAPAVFLLSPVSSITSSPIRFNVYTAKWASGLTVSATASIATIRPVMYTIRTVDVVSCKNCTDLTGRAGWSNSWLQYRNIRSLTIQWFWFTLNRHWYLTYHRILCKPENIYITPGSDKKEAATVEMYIIENKWQTPYQPGGFWYYTWEQPAR